MPDSTIKNGAEPKSHTSRVKILIIMATEKPKEVIGGGWTPYRELTQEDKTIFDQAMEGFTGINYTPFLVATQVVAGINYKFKCKASLPGNAEIWEAIVEIFKPLEGKPYITGIHRV